MKLSTHSLVDYLRGPRAPLIFVAGAIILLAVASLLIVRREAPVQQLAAQVPQTLAGAAQLPLSGPSAAPTGPGALPLEEFQITVPAGWERRQDLEDDGPGTKLMLFKGKTQGDQLFVGVDAYPLRPGTTLKQFADQYSSRNLEGKAVLSKQATLSETPARMFGLTEDSMDKLYVVAVRRDRGFVVGMIGPTGRSLTNNKAFREVVDTFQFYE